MSNLHRLFIFAMTSFPCDNSQSIVACFDLRKYYYYFVVTEPFTSEFLIPEGDDWVMGPLFKILAINID